MAVHDPRIVERWRTISNWRSSGLGVAAFCRSHTLNKSGFHRWRTRSSVRRWLNAYLDHGPDGLTPRKAKGAKPKLTPDLDPLLRQWVIDGPAEHGLDRANWTYPELADHLYKTKGIPGGKSAMQTFGVRPGIHPYGPA